MIYNKLKCSDNVGRERIIEFSQEPDDQILITLTGKDNIQLGKVFLSKSQWKTVRSLFK